MSNRANLTILLFANAVSQFAQGISMIAIPWYFINQLEEAGFFNILFFGVTALTLFWSPYAGSLIDKFPRKQLFMTLCAVGALTLFSISFLGFSSGHAPLWGICLVFAFTVLNYNLHYPALYALAQEMTTPGNSTRTNSLLEIQGQATSLMSGAFAALLITGSQDSFGWVHRWFAFEPVPLHSIFLLDGITYLLALGLLFFIRHIAIHTKNKEDIDRGSVWVRIQLGLQFLRQHPQLFRFGMFSYFVFVTVIVHMFYLVHLYVSNVLLASALVLAIAEVSHTVGALTAGIVTRKYLGNRRIRRAKQLMALVVLVYLVFFFLPTPWLLALGCLLIGFANSAIRILRVSFLFDHVPPLKMGRVASVFQSGNIFLRLILIGLFYTTFFQANPAYTYLAMALFISLALGVIWKLQGSEIDTLQKTA